jgi:hypothetical protein
MSNSSHFRRTFQRPHCAALSAVLAICIGWTLALAHAAQQSPGSSWAVMTELDGHDSTRVSSDAELRVGDPAPTPVADVAAAQASLRVPQARVRYTPNQHPLAWSAFAGPRLAFALLQRQVRARAESTSGDGAESAPHRVIARRWPLPRSSCSDSDPDADVARRA